MVTDDRDRLVGMPSMYDILLFIQPRHANIWQELEDSEQAEALGALQGVSNPFVWATCPYPTPPTTDRVPAEPVYPAGWSDRLADIPCKGLS